MSENPNHHSSPFFKGEEKANSLTAGCTVNPTLELLLTLPPRSYSLIRPVPLDVGKTTQLLTTSSPKASAVTSSLLRLCHWQKCPSVVPTARDCDFSYQPPVAVSLLRVQKGIRAVCEPGLI